MKDILIKLEYYMNLIYWIVFKENSKIIKPKDPVKEGFAFVGWYRDYDLTDEWDFSKDTVESNMHLYAKWTEGEPSGTLPSKDGKCFCWLWILLLIIIALVLRKYYKDQKRKK